MPSKQPRTPEVEVSEDRAYGFVATIYDGEYLIQIQPHENGYQLSLASKAGMGDTAFLRTYGREERFRRILETEYDAIDADAVFEVLEEHFGDTEYRIVNLKKGVKHFRGRGAYLYVETGETIFPINRRAGLSGRSMVEKRHVSTYDLADQRPLDRSRRRR